VNYLNLSIFLIICLEEKMKKGLILTAMLAGVLALGFSQPTILSGTYSYDADYNITFSGNTFTGYWGGSTMSGTYYGLGWAGLNLDITGGTMAPNKWVWTIDNPMGEQSPLIDQDGDRWNKGSTISAFAEGEQMSSVSSSTSHYLFQENFSQNNISKVSYESFGETYSYVPNIGFSVGKRIIYDGFVLLLDFVIPDSSLAVLNKEELRLLRNTIYARYGMIFQSKDLKTHFQQFNWYNPRSNNVASRLTDVDKENIKNIQVFENARPNSSFSKRDLVRRWLYYFPVPSWSPEITINDNGTIEGKNGSEDNWKGNYKIENGFLVVLVSEQYVGTADYFSNKNWRWPNGVTYNDGIVRYREPFKMIFPIGESIRFGYRDDIFGENSINQRRQIGSIVWTSWID
jgi:hypothetical protein